MSACFSERVGRLATHLLKETHENIRRQRPLVRLVENDRRVSLERVVVHCFSEEHTVRHVLEKGRALLRRVLETDRVTNFLTEGHIHLVGDTLRDTRRGDTTRLRAGNHLALELGEVRHGDELGNPGKYRRQQQVTGVESSR
jgi:hypothetical protein